jgi:hypothetical protein
MGKDQNGDLFYSSIQFRVVNPHAAISPFATRQRIPVAAYAKGKTREEAINNCKAIVVAALLVIAPNV